MTEANVQDYPLKGDFNLCLERGGHCYMRGNSMGAEIVTDTFPPTYHRICKHCGHTQHGQEQPNMRWE